MATDKIETARAILTTADQTMFRRLWQQSLRTVRNLSDPDLIRAVRAALPEAVEFDDANLVTFGGCYFGPKTTNLDVVVMTILHCADRLEKRDQGAPDHAGGR